MPLQASSLSLPLPSPSLGPTSLLLDPLSSSLAVTLSDSSVLLFPSSSPSPSAVPTVVPPVSTSSSTFLLLNPKPKNPNPNSTLFVSAFPSPSSPSVLLRAWILIDDRFSPVPLSFNNKLPRSKTLALNLSHGFGVRIVGSVNYLAVHSAASRQIWVLGARVLGDGSDGKAVDFVKCAVVECVAPIYDLRMEKGVLVLGEVDGVRVFPLRPLVKGGDVGRRRRSHRRDGAAADVGDRALGRLRTLKLRQNSGEFGSFFMMIKHAMVQDSDSNTLSSMKAVSIHILSQKKLLVWILVETCTF
ncbi:Uncharacterized protein M6B38_220555 [Iris pallida]|uniref:Uncharacterized protein n=1 Tax=Iris pallida TaxID=29817 RepID=A0AAX6DYM2_IRIPA|nr:Uncharacterized protein M6B38_220555 [Iris pallida]